MVRVIRPGEMEDWHPLDGVPAPEYIPEQWEGPHVGVRIMEAFRTLSRIPASRGPKMFGTAWPAYSYEWGDMLAQQEQDADERRRHESAQNRSTIMPSAEDVTRMERCLYWPSHYLWEVFLLYAVNRLASARAIDRDSEWVARRYGGAADHWRVLHDDGCGRIAERLIRDRVAVF